jgi:hypothetical protein
MKPLAARYVVVTRFEPLGKPARVNVYTTQSGTMRDAQRLVRRMRRDERDEGVSKDASLLTIKVRPMYVIGDDLHAIITE